MPGRDFHPTVQVRLRAHWEDPPWSEQVRGAEAAPTFDELFQCSLGDPRLVYGLFTLRMNLDQEMTRKAAALRLKVGDSIVWLDEEEDWQDGLAHDPDKWNPPVLYESLEKILEFHGDPLNPDTVFLVEFDNGARLFVGYADEFAELSSWGD